MKKFICRLLTNYIYEVLSNDMSCYFDEIQDNEEEVYGKIYYSLLHDKMKDKQCFLQYFNLKDFIISTIVDYKLVGFKTFIVSTALDYAKIEEKSEEENYYEEY